MCRNKKSEDKILAFFVFYDGLYPNRFMIRSLLRQSFNTLEVTAERKIPAAEESKVGENGR